jgi:iron-sulfur cluster insertion protein
MGQAAVDYSTDLVAGELALTEAARGKMRELFTQIEDDDMKAIRVFVSGGGCGGMGYGMTFTDSRSEYDSVRSEDGFDIYVDAVALNFLRGVEIDYVEKSTGASFVFNNAFAVTGGSGTCGACGSAGGGCA